MFVSSGWLEIVGILCLWSSFKKIGRFGWAYFGSSFGSFVRKLNWFCCGCWFLSSVVVVVLIWVKTCSVWRNINHILWLVSSLGNETSFFNDGLLPGLHFIQILSSSFSKEPTSRDNFPIYTFNKHMQLSFTQFNFLLRDG